MATKIASTVFAGNASDELVAEDVYVADVEAQRRLQAAIDSGEIDATDIPVRSTSPESEGSKRKEVSERRGLRDVVDKINAEATRQTGRAMLAGMADYSRSVDDGNTRFQAALVGLSTALPIQLPAACQAIIDNFRSQIRRQAQGYETVRDGISHFIESDQVQCAIQAFEMLSSIKGIQNKIETVLIDAEAEAQVLAGMVNTLIDYEMVDNLEAVLGTSPSTRVMRMALEIASPRAIQSGNFNLLNIFLDKIGVTDMIFNNPHLTHNAIQYYNDQKSGGYNPALFFTTLNRIDPHWDRPGNVQYYLVNQFDAASPSAQKAFLSHPTYGAIVMSSEVEYFQQGMATPYPTAAEVTRDLYPNVVSPLVEYKPYSIY